MRRVALLLIPVLLAATAHADEALDPEVAALSAIASRWSETGMSPGMGVVVVRNGRPIYVEGLGTADLATGEAVSLATRFYIASTSKSFLGLTAALLHQQGRIDLDRPLNHYLPSVVLRRPADASAITLRDLLARVLA